MGMGMEMGSPSPTLPICIPSIQERDFARSMTFLKKNPRSGTEMEVSDPGGRLSGDGDDATTIVVDRSFTKEIR
ncbi:hypothetical protein Syun_012145 [Stephania yunnanensis]|uniref:Uncharacterized protein n=1 Tax=Stephania yunnanensis TaxID=152371 RepID=A0AAP0JZY3_9MAGN